jgi:hypothetical protein
MAGELTHEKEQLHELVERLAPSQVHAVRGLLRVMLDPVSRAIANAPVDDEPLTADDARALDEAREWLKRSEPIPHEQVLAELGITLEEIENCREPA